MCFPVLKTCAASPCAEFVVCRDHAGHKFVVCHDHAHHKFVDLSWTFHLKSLYLSDRSRQICRLQGMQQVYFVIDSFSQNIINAVVGFHDKHSHTPHLSGLRSSSCGSVPVQFLTGARHCACLIPNRCKRLCLSNS